jgi:hypothetical protein
MKKELVLKLSKDYGKSAYRKRAPWEKRILNNRIRELAAHFKKDKWDIIYSTVYDCIPELLGYSLEAAFLHRLFSTTKDVGITHKNDGLVFRKIPKKKKKAKRGKRP